MFGISTVKPSGSVIKDLVNVISVDFFQRHRSWHSLDHMQWIF